MKHIKYILPDKNPAGEKATVRIGPRVLRIFFFACGFAGLLMLSAFDIAMGPDTFPLVGHFEFSPNLMSQVPVPASLWLLGSAIGLLVWVRRRGTS